MIESEQEKREASGALELLENPGFSDVLRDAMREAKAARKVLFSEALPEQYAHARGSLAVLKNVVFAVYRRANKEIPPHITALFE